ncbi:hypothetical protein D3C73_1200760 [compost metagenome]
MPTVCQAVQAFHLQHLNANRIRTYTFRKIHVLLQLTQQLLLLLCADIFQVKNNMRHSPICRQQRGGHLGRQLLKHTPDHR